MQACRRSPYGGGTAIDTYKLLDEIDSLIEESKNYFGLALISREDLFDLVHKLRASLPDEMRRANRVNAESERIVVGAREAAEQTVVDAHTDAKRLVETAQAQADKMMREAETRAQGRLQESDNVAHKTVNEARAQAHQLTHDARLAAEKMIAEATRRAEHLISDSEVMRLATAQAKEIVGGAEGEAREMRRDADEYAREELSRLERVLTDSILTVQRGRNKLDQRITGAEAAAPTGTGRAAATPAEMASARR